MKNKILILTLLMGLVNSLMARDAVDLLQNKRVNLLYGLALIQTQRDAALTSSVQMTSVNVYSYSRDNQFYFGIGADTYSSIVASDDYLQTDNSVVAGMMLGDAFNTNFGFGVSTISTSAGNTPSAFLVNNLNLFFLDISVFTLKTNYYLGTGALNVAVLIGLTF